jgi:hypothetical protein
MVAAVTLVLVTTPFAGAVTPSTSVTLHAPYPGAVTWGGNSVTTAGCAIAKNLQKALWNSTTGKGRWSEAVRASSCPSQLGGSSSTADAQGGYWIALPISLSTSGHYRVIVHWNLLTTIFRSSTAGTCQPSSATSYSCAVGVYLSFYATAGLLDATSGKKYLANKVCLPGGCHSIFGGWSYYNTSSNSTHCRSGSCKYSNVTTTSGGFGSPLTWYINKTGNLSASDSYVLQLSFYADAATYVESTNTAITGASSTESWNGGTLGNFEKLTSVVIR